jgi:hypothetical protein
VSIANTLKVRLRFRGILVNDRGRGPLVLFWAACLLVHCSRVWAADESADWRFCTVGQIGDKTIYITELFRDTRASQAVEADIQDWMRHGGSSSAVIQCRMPALRFDAVVAFDHAEAVNRAIKSEIVELPPPW